ncbi:MAG: hypothetical protein IT343_23655, partial [Candidatus Melainabacteria bacterium]|nr:hypothetical protein [Candidatus Melainabacteria bacterium]
MIRKLTMSALVVVALAMQVPAFAQAQGDEFSSGGTQGAMGDAGLGGNTGSQAEHSQDSNAP